LSYELTDKVVVVTGGAGLLGRAFVRCIAAQGGIAVVADICEDTGKAFIEALENEALPGRAEFISLDITSQPSVASVVSQLHKQYGRVDALVNAAYPRNRNYGRKFEDVTYDDFCQNMSMHVGGYFLTSQQFSVFFKNQGYGSIVNLASVYGVVAPRFEIYEGTPLTMPVEYAAIKSAIIHLTKYMAKYFKGDNVRVNCISPGGIEDGQTETFLANYNSHGMSKGMLGAEDLTGALVFLLSDASKYVNGQNLIVDDGWTL
jgi:NAD(P)-dependent dehydrogenase (short-subunit alcohol dehydrogenase family)